MADRDTYRCMSTGALLQAARGDGIDAELAIVLAERLEHHYHKSWMLHGSSESMGGRYNFNNRSIA